MSDKKFFENKIEYLKSKFNDDHISEKELKDFRKNGTLKKGRTMGELWWRSIRIEYEEIPPCSNCMKDTELYKEYIFSGSKKSFDYRRFKCCKWCIWWDWFEKIRSNYNTNLKINDL